MRGTPTHSSPKQEIGAKYIIRLQFSIAPSEARTPQLLYVSGYSSRHTLGGVPGCAHAATPDGNNTGRGHATNTRRSSQITSNLS